MKRKRIIQIVTLALAVTTIATTAFATSVKREGYDMFKKSFKSMRTMKITSNGTMNVTLDVEDNGVNIVNIDGKVKADHEAKKMSGAFKVGVQNVTKDIEIYANDKEKIIVDATENKYYKINEPTHYRLDELEHRGMKHEFMGEMTVQQEAFLDYFIGGYKDNFEFITKEDGNKVISFNLNEEEIPVPINLLISAAASAEQKNRTQIEVRGSEFKCLPLFEELIEVNDLPNLIEDIKVKGLGLNLTLNEESQMIATSFNIKIEGKDEQGINHEMVVKGSIEINDIDETVVNTINLLDKEVTVIKCQTNK
ncbi:hypothetical protein [Oceanirhabdus sp. W0125-5]|uniref:hypothetical protein n=1 Tax=Oceanirhabdus sp. W0125-5 TaxID=2999116 RepID=UPI0022F32B3B|nr:hypothetical protein [Oceanirhabdus sp. W0125-5]WBW95604.1 hypothetical protein OW730_18165 [Oceanirhabdus sp. W0125-5]